MNFLFPYMARWKAINWTRYHQIFTRLANMGHNVYILQPPSSNMKETNFQEIDIAVPKNIHLIDVKLNPAIWNYRFPLNKLIKKGYYTLASRKKIKEAIKEFDIDVLFLYNIPQYPLMNGHHCITIFDFADDYIAMLQHELGRMSNPYILKYAQSILDKMINKSDLTLAVSNVLVYSINDRERKNVKVIPNGASLDDFILKDVSEKREAYKKPVVGFIGAFEYFIDFDLILTIAQHLPDITFLLVGGGRDFERVRNKTESEYLRNVIFTGPVPHSNIAHYINEMDICLNIFKDMAVSHSACPIKLFEYLLMKKPVISNRLREIELINKEFIFFADTVDDFVHAIDNLLKNQALAFEYGQRGYEIAVKEYAWDSIVDKLVHLIEEVKSKQC